MVDQLCSGESIADLLGILCLFGADGRPTLLGESIAESCLTRRGVKVSWSNSSAESTFVPGEQSSCTVWTTLIAPAFMGEGTCGGLDNCRFDKSSSGRQVTRYRDIVVRFWSLTFAWTALSGFQSIGIPIFSQVALSGFQLVGCTYFFCFIPNFCPNLFGSSGCPCFT